MPKNRVTHPIILGIVGDSATGKTTLSQGLADILGPDRVALICTDDYHRYSRAERAENGVSALDPKGNYIDIIEQHLNLLRQGQPILKPVYNHNGGTLDAPEYIEPKPYIIVEGLLGYTTRRMRDCYDVKIFLDPEDDLRFRWKVRRDTEKRGYSKQQVLSSLTKRKKDSPAFIAPQRTFADMVVRFRIDGDLINGSDDHLSVRHILRPTLPHPNLSPLLDGGANSGIHITLARDNDGKPVDVLELDGSISDRRSERLQDLLWGLIPEASHLRDNVGAYDDRLNRRAMSHPLALTQLLIAYHMVKAAVGEYAI